MRLIISVFVLFLIVFGKTAFAEEGIRITEPLDGATVNPGEEINIAVEPVDGLELREVLIVTPFAVETLTAPPFSARFMVPSEAVGTFIISADEQDSAGKFVEDEITLNVQQTAVLQSLEIHRDRILVQIYWDGSIDSGDTGSIGTVYGEYSDGIEREITHVGTIYVSSNPEVISIGNDGNYTVHRVGEANITVSNSGISKVIPVIFQEPLGRRPAEVIRPVTQINIQPQPNAAGWHSSDAAVTLTASDNEGGSGVKEINYGLVGMRGMPLIRQTSIEGDRVEIPIVGEGIGRLFYGATDNAGNVEKNHFVDIKLDKTSPQTSCFINPAPDEEGIIRFLPVRINFSATDNLSGVAHTTENRIINESGVYQIQYFSEDMAGNVEEPKIATINISIQDAIPPRISLKLAPARLNILLPGRLRSPFANSYKLLYSATDRESGVKNIKCGLITPNIDEFRTQLIRPIRDEQPEIIINEEEKLLIIRAPKPETILAQLRKTLLFIQNNQLLYLKLIPRTKVWTIVPTDKYIFISAPSIVFKAEARDNAGNMSTKELRYNN